MPKHVFRPLLATGSAKRIVAAWHGGIYPVLTFLNEELAARPDDQDKVKGLLDRIAAHGLPASPEKNKKVYEDIWELKSHQIRIFYFHLPGHLVVLASGIVKKKDALPKEAIAHAAQVMASTKLNWAALSKLYPYARE